MMSRYSRPLAAAVVVLAIGTPPAAAQKRATTEKDLFRFVWVADPQMSPDGSQVAFVRVTIDEKKDEYHTAIWLASADGREPPRRLTSGTRDSAHQAR